MGGCAAFAQVDPPPPSRTKWTRRVPHPVLIGHAASLVQPESGLAIAVLKNAYVRKPRPVAAQLVRGAGRDVSC